MKTISATIVALILFVSLALTPALSSAQGTAGPGETYMNNDATTGTGGTTGTTTTDTTTDNGFNPLWLLPLLAIPVIYFIYKASNDDARERRYDTREPLAGAKGGRSERRDSDTEEVL
jgi:hypothetical protein